jgi:membrane protein DedA with SNARE-associated domain
MFELAEWLPRDFPHWAPFWQAASLILLSFLLEDLATVGAGLLLAAGAIGWPAAFWGCFIGVWTGDAGLYGFARVVGRGWFDRKSGGKFRERLRQSERRFHERGSPVLLLSRLLPGTRLPTYLTAGFLRMPLKRFLAVTGLASLMWTVGILFVAQLVGGALLRWLRVANYAGWALVVGIVGVVVVVKLGRSWLGADARQGLVAWFGRWHRWEFWPPWLFYPPVGLFYLWFAIKHRGLTLPTAANPGMFSGGLVGESKAATLRELAATSPEVTAEAHLLEGATPEERFQRFQKVCQQRSIPLPLVLKPDMGQRGNGVKVVRSVEEARAYLEGVDAPVVLQRYAPGPKEAGVFYYRFPHEPAGHIFAITEKVFPVLTGDGRSTVEQLIQRDARARYVAPLYLCRFAHRRHEVLAPGQELKLVETGNHAQGCVFLDGWRLHSPALEAAIDRIAQRLNGFYIGRFDLRYASEDDLRQGRNFLIVELNGAASEATSIYDPRNTLTAAYRVLFRQWALVFAIGAANRARGHATLGVRALWQAWTTYRRRAATYPMAD